MRVARLMTCVFVSTQYGWSALMFASRNGHIGCVKILLRKGADVNLQSETLETTALLYAAKNGYTDICRYCHNSRDNGRSISPLLILYTGVLMLRLYPACWSNMAPRCRRAILLE